MIMKFERNRYGIRAIISHFVRWPSQSRFSWMKPTVVRFRSVILPKYSYLNIILNSIIVRNRYDIVIQLCYSFHGDERIKHHPKSTRCFSPRTKRQLQWKLSHLHYDVKSLSRPPTHERTPRNPGQLVNPTSQVFLCNFVIL